MKHKGVLRTVSFLAASMMAAASLLVFVFDGYIISCAVGYTIGLPVTVAAYFIYGAVKGRSSHSGDGKNENTDDN